MATNPTPTNDTELLLLCGKLLQGCLELKEDLGIKETLATLLQEQLTSTHAALAEVEKQKAERSTLRKELRDWDQESERVLSRCRLRLAALFGNGYNDQWEAAGFPDRSTMVPEVFAKRLALLAQLAAYFTARPEHESQDMRATTAICEMTHQSLSGVRALVDHHKSILQNAVQKKNEELKQLRKRLRSLIDELGLLLAEDDIRWRRFGLNPPAGEPLPEPVGQAVLTALGQGTVRAQWSPALHALRYHVQMRVMGVGDFATLITLADTEILLPDLPPGEFIEVRVIAANTLEEAAPCPASAVLVG
ncbi:MAG: fibronectin type III domain-containing protein [Prosthecobacter sp.]|uniref:fibronectin type III domain-containing protein n=1 Tax=Prosthecobacter sp. TaxID=1965333 RepID=UPI0025DE6F59|nr:fibronectin type III domain-containing protein [Prosthecobacter sp.]MCF7786737.1 fibronectin type III domain-containing protein [Prosthecobacter sp.]